MAKNPLAFMSNPFTTDNPKECYQKFGIIGCFGYSVIGTSYIPVSILNFTTDLTIDWKGRKQKLKSDIAQYYTTGELTSELESTITLPVFADSLSLDERIEFLAIELENL